MTPTRFASPPKTVPSCQNVLYIHRLRFLALSNARVNAAQYPNGREQRKHAERDDNRLPVARSPGVVVRHNEIAIPKVVGHVDSSQLERGTAKRVHEGPVEARRVADDGHGGLELDVGSALGEDDAEVDASVRDAFIGAGALEEGDPERIGVASGELAQVSGQLGVPADAEAVLPLAKYRVSGLQLKQCFLVARAELGGGDVANVVGEVRVHGTGAQEEAEAPERRGGWVHVRLLLPLDTREVVFEAGALVDKPVALLGGQVAAPVRNLEVALQQGGVGDGLGELVAHAYGLLCAGWHVGVLAVCEGRALLLRVGLLLLVELGRQGRVVGHIAGGELELGALLLGEVGGWRVRAEGVLQVLLVRLRDLGGHGLEGGEDGVGDADGLLRLGCEGLWELDLVELGGAGGVLV